MVYNSYEPTLFITDPAMVNEMYVSKNKYLDKHEAVGNALHPLMGDTLLFQSSNENWREKRRALTSVFYKDKIIKMMKNICVATGTTMSEWY